MTGLRRVALIGLLIFLVISSGCVEESQRMYVCQSGDTVSNPDLCPKETLSSTQPAYPSSQNQASNTYSPSSIVEFSSADEGDLIRFFFQLQDSSGRKISASGQVEFTILDNSDNVLYEKSFSVSPSQFVEYEFKLTGKSVGKFFEWRVPINEIKKGVSKYGKAEIIFRSNGKELTAMDELVSIPSLSEEEIKAANEKEYQKNAANINLTLNDEGMNIIILKSGFYTTYSYIDKEEQFRVDLRVENKGDGDRNFRAYGSVLLGDKGNQYESSYGGTISSEELKQGVTKTGYLLFADVPKDISVTKIQIGDDYIFDIKNLNAYTPKQMFEEEYDKTKIVFEKTISKGEFQVEVKSFGFYKTKSYSTTEENFRVDFFVKNIGSESEYFSPSSMSILDSDGNQYENSYGGTLDTSKNMFPNTKQEGYVLFEEVPKTITSAKLMFELGRDSDWDPYLFEFNLTDLPTTTYLTVPPITTTTSTIVSSMPPLKPEDVFDIKTITLLNELEIIDSDFDATSFETKIIMVNFWDSLSETSSTDTQIFLNRQKAEFQEIYKIIIKLDPPLELKPIITDYTDAIRTRIEAINIFNEYVVRGVLGSQRTAEYQRRSMEVTSTWMSGNIKIANAQDALSKFYSDNHVSPKSQLVDRIDDRVIIKEYDDLIVSLSIDTGGLEFGWFNTIYVDMSESDKILVNVNVSNTGSVTYNNVDIYCSTKSQNDENGNKISSLFNYDKSLGTIGPLASKSISFKITLSELMDGIICYV